ncbi:MAG: beta-galactosidase [Solirubrobacteraceae bacterium]|nr:beta-galactosidase [Solirubrobacteraceae bacterium]
MLVLAVAAGGVWLFVLDGGDDGGNSPAPRGGAPAPAGGTAADRALLTAGGGPVGSRPVRLTRWRYRADPQDRGVREGWARDRPRGRFVHVPYSPNATTISGPAGFRAMAGSVGWYVRAIHAPAAGRYVIAFESVHHRATVYVDGRPRRTHVGAYQPFSARARLSRGRHTIAVRVDWRDPVRIAASGYARGWFNYGGINRPVTLARVGPSELGALNVRTRLRDGRAVVDISLRVRNHAANSRRVDARGSLSHGGASTALHFDGADVASGRSRTVRATATLDHPALWSPTDPERYELRVEVPGEAAIDRMLGVRELTWGSGGLALNGTPLVLRGAALPPDARKRGDALRPIDEVRLVQQLRAVGANATRVQQPLPESLLNRLDAAGILVWQLIGPWENAGVHVSTTVPPAGRDRALRVAENQQPHPSIIAWSLTNELNGGGLPNQRRYIRLTADRLHKLDPSRPVAVDIWGSHLPTAAGGAYSGLDAVGVTDYIGWYSDLDAGSAGQTAVARERIAQLHGLFPDKPIVITELGAIGSRAEPSPGVFGGLHFQANLLARRIAGLRGAPGLSGMIVWSLRDYALRPDFDGGSVLKLRPDLRVTPGLNEKGLYDYAGRPKPALAAVRRAFGRG